MTTIVNGTEYTLATTLRVAYNIQGQHNHKSYMEIFKNMETMPLEHQIGIIYAAFQVANPEQARFINQKTFTDYYLDNYKLSDVLNQIKDIIGGILGEDVEEPTEEVAQDSERGNLN